MNEIILLSLLFFGVAVLYSSVGFGGGSSYLAILVLAGVDLFLMRSTALMCNIIVVSGGTYLFIKGGHLNFKQAFILAGLSVPFAFMGGYLPLNAKFIFVLLGFTLFIASVLLLINKTDITATKSKLKNKKSIKATATIGTFIGFISGMVGIGGGIFLSPVLHFMKWDTSKKIAAMASFFILCNSTAGLAGQWLQNSIYVDIMWSWPLLIAVFAGGQIGSRLAIKKFNHQTIRKLTGLVILLASFKILNDHLLNLV